MKKMIQKIINLGADFSTRKALKSTLKFLGIKPVNIDRLYVELKNDYFRDTFKKLPPRKKMIFLPQCLRNPNCKAGITKTGHKCVACSNRERCKAFKIKSKAEAMGYRVFIVPGGSMVFKLIKRYRPEAVLGVGCMKELVIAVENINIPGQAVELTRDGCINTDVSMKEIMDIL